MNRAFSAAGRLMRSWKEGHPLFHFLLPPYRAPWPTPSPAGWSIDRLSWTTFFLLGFTLALPGLILLIKIAHFSPRPTPSGADSPHAQRVERDDQGLDD